jgi:hypothetical protein
MWKQKLPDLRVMFARRADENYKITLGTLSNITAQASLLDWFRRLIFHLFIYYKLESLFTTI